MLKQSRLVRQYQHRIVPGLVPLLVFLSLVFASFPATAAAVSPHGSDEGADTCSSCHAPHQAATSRGMFRDFGEPKGEVSVCLSCHDGSDPGVSSDIKNGPDSFGLSSGHELEDVVDLEAADLTNACSGCHTPHGDSALRPKLPASSINSVTVETADNGWCLACHDDDQSWYANIGTYPSLSDPSRDASGYPTAGVFAGASVYTSTTANAHVSIPASSEPTHTPGDCLYCHNAHGSASLYDSLVATLAPSTDESVAQDRATGDYAALCFGCHGGGSWETSGAANIKQYATADADDTSLNAAGGHRIKTDGGNLPVDAPLPCYDCHNPHGSSRNNTSLFSDALGASLDTSASPEAVRGFCLSCHVTSDLYGWDSESDAYELVSDTDAVEGLLRNGGSFGSGPDDGYNWLRLKVTGGHQLANSSASCYECHGNEYGTADLKNVHNPSLYSAEQHRVGGPCVTSGCHSTDANTIHEEGPACTACHAVDETPSFVCAECHVGDQHPAANHVNGSPCGGCHAETNLMSVHGDDCAKCHPTPAQGMTYAGGCSQAGCHPSEHVDPWDAYAVGHSQVGWGHGNWGNDCWDCHELNDDMGTACTTPYCHPHVYERIPPTTTSNAVGSYVGGAIITLSATDAGGYWGGQNPQWYIAGVRTTYYQVNGGDLQTGELIIIAPPSSGTSTNTIEFWSMDNNYNTEAHNIVSFTVTAGDSDDTPPTGTMSVNDGAAYTVVTSVTVNSAVTDAESGVSFMRIDPGTGVYGLWTAYTASQAITLPSGEGTKTVRAEYMNGGGNILALSGTIVFDATAPTGSITINGGASNTTTMAAVLNLSANDTGGSGLYQMRFSNDDITWSTWETYATTKNWTLTSGNGLKTVYAQFRDGASNVSTTYSDTITLFDGIDPTPPTGAVTINGVGVDFTKTTTSTLILSASDTGGSGLSEMRFSNDDVTWSTWETYASTRSWTLTSGEGTKTVYAQFRDGSGNVSTTYSDTITLDVTAPTGSITINGGAGSTGTTAVTLNLSASDTGGSGLYQMRFSNDDITWSTWETYATTKSWTLPSGNGLKTVSAQFRDGASNMSTTYSDTITLTLNTATLAFVWHPYDWAEAHLRVEDAGGGVVIDTWIEGWDTDLDLSVSVTAGQLYYMECLYYYDDWEEAEGGPYGIWSNNVSINPDGVLSPGETVTWYY